MIRTFTWMTVRDRRSLRGFPREALPDEGGAMLERIHTLDRHVAGPGAAGPGPVSRSLDVRAFCSLLLVGGPIMVATPSPSPESVGREFRAAIERGDVPAAMARVAEDFTFRDRAGTLVVGREDLGPMLAWDVAVGGEPSVRELEVSGDTVRAVIVETNELTRLLELGAVVVDATFVVRDGRIVEEIVEERTGDGPSYTERFRRALEPVLDWAAEWHPDRLDAVLMDKGLRYDGPTARELLRLIRAWRDAA